MAKGAGKDLLLKIDVAGTPTTLGALRSVGMSGSAEEIDVSSIDSSQWKEILDGAGQRSFTLSGSGILADTAPVDNVRDAFLNQTLTTFNIVEVNGTWAGSFKITSFEITGEYNGAQTYSISLASSGAVTFT